MIDAEENHVEKRHAYGLDHLEMSLLDIRRESSAE
jgi:hypothetical protein